jgi:hypothetical protein
MTINTETTRSIAEQIKFLQDLEKGRFDPEKKRTEIKEKEGQISILRDEIIVLNGELAAYYRATDEPIPADEGVLSHEEIGEKIAAVMPLFRKGGSGKAIADRTGDHRITATTIGEYYRTAGQTTLKKGRNAKGKIGMGTETKYFLATEADAALIAADQKEEQEIKDARDAKKKAKLAEKATK